jgi:hypothetical protein
MSTADFEKKRPLPGFSGFRREKAEAPKMRKRKSALCWYYIVFGQGCQGVRGRDGCFFSDGRFLKQVRLVSQVW